MDPYLERAEVWEEVHTRLIVAIADALGPQVRPKYRVGVEQVKDAEGKEVQKRANHTTCGAWPVLAEQCGLEQLRYLRCGLCASSWEADRLLCPFCITRDFHVLGYLQVEGEEPRQRVATCDA